MAEKKVDVQVVLAPPGSKQPYHFESKDVPIDKDNVIYFHNCGSNKGFVVNYNVDDKLNPGFFFPTQNHNGDNYLDQALWAAQSSNCPTQPCKWSVFEAARVDGNGKTLVVTNKNEISQDFAYTLRVVKGTDWLNLDPGGANRNGGTTKAAQLAIGIATGAIVGLGAVSIASNAFDVANAVAYGIGGAVVGLIVALLFNRM